MLLLMLNAANSGRDVKSNTISYQLSSQKCLDNGWTVWPPARPSFHCVTADTHSECDEMWEADEPLYKVSHLSWPHCHLPDDIE